MSEIKIKYYFSKHSPVIFTLSQIEHGALEHCGKKEYGKIVARAQFTGLIDQEGAEIYGGDIVRKDKYEITYKVKHGHYVEDVNGGEYTNDCYGWHVGKNEEFSDWEQLQNSASWRVVGNVTQHPELLEQATCVSN